MIFEVTTCVPWGNHVVPKFSISTQSLTVNMLCKYFEFTAKLQHEFKNSIFLIIRWCNLFAIQFFHNFHYSKYYYYYFSVCYPWSTCFLLTFELWSMHVMAALTHACRCLKYEFYSAFWTYSGWTRFSEDYLL